MNSKKVIVSIIVIAVILTAVFGSWKIYQSQQTPHLTLYGNVDIRSVNMSFRVPGRLAALDVDEGDIIKSGEPLGLLDNAPFLIAVRQAQANVDAAQAQYDLIIAGYRDEEIAQAAAQVDSAQSAYDYAQSFYQRQQGMWATRAVSANDLQNARVASEQAKAALTAAKDKLHQYRSGNRPQQIAQAQAVLQQANAELAQTQLNLQDTTLLAPADGTILVRSVEPGTLLNAGSTVLTLALTRPVWIRAYVSEAHLGQAQPGREVLIYTDSRPDKPYRGKIGFVSPSAEFTPKTVETPELRTDLVYRLRAIVTDADDILRQGMPVSLTFDDGASHGQQ